MRRRALRTLAVVTSLLVAVALAWFVFAWIEAGRFDSTKWKADGPRACGEEKHRAVMVGDLTSDHLYAGMPKDEVRALLGTPDQTAASDVWRYDLGGFVDCEYLTLRFAGDRLSLWERGQT